MSRRRVVITGLGTVNPLANNVPDYWAGLLAGRSGIAPITQFDASAFRVHFAGEVKNFDPAKAGLDFRAVKRMDRFAQFAMAAAAEAIRDSGVDFSKEDPFRCGVILGCGVRGLNTFHHAPTHTLPSPPPPFTLPIPPHTVPHTP